MFVESCERELMSTILIEGQSDGDRLLASFKSNGHYKCGLFTEVLTGIVMNTRLWWRQCERVKTWWWTSQHSANDVFLILVPMAVSVFMCMFVCHIIL